MLPVRYTSSMRSWEDIRADELRAMFPSHDIWTVRYSTCRHTSWHSRPKGEPIATISVDSADELQAAIALELAGETSPPPDVPNIVRKYS